MALLQFHHRFTLLRVNHHQQQIVVLLLLLLQPLSSAAPVGICYGRVADNLPSPVAVAALLRTNNVTRVRIFDTDPEVLRSLAGLPIELMIGIPNELLPTLSNNNAEFTLQWLQSNVFAHIPASQIRYISVGNEVFVKDPYYAQFLVPAIINLHQALETLNLAQSVKLSTAHAACVIASSFPPSNGSFVAELRHAMATLLQFLQDTNSPFMVNIYPFYSYSYNPKSIPLDYALFRTPNIVLDEERYYYNNLFDATLDSFVAAMEKEGFGDVPILVAETGWPKSGGSSGVATPEYAMEYNRNVIRRSVDQVGTPRRPGRGIEVFLFDLFDEDLKGGEECERHFGIFQLDGAKAYELSFS